MTPLRDVRRVPKQPTATEQSDELWASSSQPPHLEKQRGDVKRAGAEARTSEYDRALVNNKTVSRSNKKNNILERLPMEIKSHFF